MWLQATWPLKYQLILIFSVQPPQAFHTDESKYNACSHTWDCFYGGACWSSQDKILSWPQSVSLKFFGRQLFVHTYFIWKSISSVHSWKWACRRECANTCAHDVWAKTAFNHFMGCILDTKRVKSVLLLTNSITIYCWSMTLKKTTGSPRLLHTPLSLNHRHKHNNNSEVKSEIDLYSVLFQLSDSSRISSAFSAKTVLLATFLYPKHCSVSDSLGTSNLFYTAQTQLSNTLQASVRWILFTFFLSFFVTFRLYNQF